MRTDNAASLPHKTVDAVLGIAVRIVIPVVVTADYPLWGGA